jgi:hypothetical protein
VGSTIPAEIIIMFVHEGRSPNNHVGGYIMLAVESCNCLSQPFSANSLSNFHHNIGCSVGPLFGNCAWSLMRMYRVNVSCNT